MIAEMIRRFLRSVQQRDIVWTDKYLSKTPIHAGFWNRIRLDDTIRKRAGCARGVLLDVGCGLKPYEIDFAPFVRKHFGLEYFPESGYRGNRADVAGDASCLPFADATIDTILCTEVLEHVANPEKAIEEFSRVLAPGGIAITTAPFFYPVHDSHDFFRYTDKGLAAMMKRHGLEVVEVTSLSGGGVTLALMFNLYWYELGFLWTKWLYPIGLIFRPLLWLAIGFVNCLGWLLERLVPARQMAFNHMTVARKRPARSDSADARSVSSETGRLPASC